MASKQTFFLPSTGNFYTPLPGFAPRPVMEWEKPADGGKARPSDTIQQKLDGVPLWETDVILQKLNFGKPEAEIISIRYASADGKMPVADAPHFESGK